MSASNGHRPDIQGLRAVAVLLVALNHAGVGLVPGGFVGVDVFFVLSGFLITGLLLAEARATGSVSLLDFYLRRARRIVPAAALTMLATDVAAVLLLNFVRARDAVADSLYASGFAANFRFAARGTDYFARTDPPSPFLHFWSLAVEEQFYVVWPLLLSLVLVGVAFLRRRRARRLRFGRLLVVVVALAALSLGCSVRLTASTPQAAYFSPFARAWELGLGAALAVGASALARVAPAGRLALGWAGLLAIGAAALVYTDRTPFPGSAALLPTVGAALVIAAGIGERHSRLAVGRLLARRPLLVVGDRSYAFYLWHWPVLVLAAEYLGGRVPVAANLGLLAAAFALSCVTFALVENPIRHRVRRRATTGVVFAAAMAAVLGTAALSLGAVDRERQRFLEPAAASAAVAAQPAAVDAAATASGALPDVVASVEAARAGAALPAGLTPPVDRLKTTPSPYRLPTDCISRDSSAVTTSRLCRLGNTASRRTIVLVGDSHALMWLPAVTQMGLRDGWAVVPVIRTGCMPNWWLTADGPQSCRDWYRWVLAEVRRLHPAVTLVGGSVDERITAATFAAANGIIAAARTLKSYGPVDVIGDPESLSQSPVDCLLARNASMASCTTTWPAASLQTYDSIHARARQLGAGFVATRGLVCYDRSCPAVIGHTIAYWDNSHLNATYVLQVAGAFRAAFLAASR
jgi:peptidoglycan/LPS O-acetylase OafA/YrhL